MSLKGRLTKTPVANPKGIPINPPMKVELLMLRTLEVSIAATAKNVAKGSDEPSNQRTEQTSNHQPNEKLLIQGWLSRHGLVMRIQ